MGLQEIAGYYGNLKRGFDEIGVEAVFVNLVHHPFGYPAEASPNAWVAAARWAARRRAGTPRSQILEKVWWAGLQQVLKVPVFLWAVLNYDVFIFGYRSTFFGYRELPLLKWLRKRILYVFHGTDSRPPYIDGSVMRQDGSVSVDRCIQLTGQQKATLTRIERYADAIVSHPMSSQLHERPFVFAALLGLPCAPMAAREEVRGDSGRGPVRILHAPSDPEGKGTARIRAAVERLRVRGRRIELVEIAGRPHPEVVRELARCDFVVDQLYSDTPMAGFATEAAFFGKPAVMGGYAGEEIKRIFPPNLLPPSHYCHPEEIEEAMDRLVTDAAYRAELGRRARQFVEGHWTPGQVAARYLRLALGDLPQEWVVHPADIAYVHGGGMPALRLRQVLRDVLARGGVAALRVSDKPELERKFIELAEA